MAVGKNDPVAGNFWVGITINGPTDLAGVHDAHFRAGSRQSQREVRADGGLPHAAFAAGDRNDIFNFWD